MHILQCYINAAQSALDITHIYHKDNETVSAEASYQYNITHALLDRQLDTSCRSRIGVLPLY